MVFERFLERHLQLGQLLLNAIELYTSVFLRTIEFLQLILILDQIEVNPFMFILLLLGQSGLQWLKQGMVRGEKR